MAGRNIFSLVGDVKFDELDLTYNGSDELTKVEYKNSGTVVLTLDLTYTAGNLTNVVKSIPA